MSGRRPPSSRTALVFMGLGALVVTLRAAAESLWMLTVLPLTVGAIYLVERRGRARASRAAREGGEPTWHGRVHPYSLWIWPDLRLRWWSPHTEGVPAALTVGAAGLTLTRRTRRRSLRLQPVTIPWSDVAGARSRDRGHRGPSGTTFTTLRQTEVTIDVVGRSADESALDAGQPAGSEGSRARAAMDAATRATVAQVAADACPDWRQGTAPLVFVTAAPAGLVERLAAGAAGSPRTLGP